MLEVACIRRYRELMRYAEWERDRRRQGNLRHPGSHYTPLAARHSLLKLLAPGSAALRAVSVRATHMMLLSGRFLTPH